MSPAHVLVLTTTLIASAIQIASPAVADDAGITITHSKVEGVQWGGEIRRFAPLFAESADGREVYVLVRRTGVIYVLDAKTDEILRTKPLGSLPQWMVFKDDHLWIYFATAKELQVFNPETLDRESSFPVKGYAGGLTSSDGIGHKVLLWESTLSERGMYGEAAIVRAFDSQTLKETDPFTLGQVESRTDPLVQLKAQKRSQESTIEQMERRLAAYDTTALDNQLRDLNDGLKSKELSETVRELIQREIKLVEGKKSSARSSSARYSQSLALAKAELQSLDKKIAAMERERSAEATAAKPMDVSSLRDLDLTYASPIDTRALIRTRGGAQYVSVSPSGRFLLARLDQKLIRILVDKQSLIPLESSPKVGVEEFAFSNDGQFVESVGTGGEGYKMNSYSASNVAQRMAVHDTGAYPRACAHDRGWPFFYAQEFDYNFLVFNEWTGAKLKTYSITKRGDDVGRFFALKTPGHVYAALDSGLYHVRVAVDAESYTPNWKLITQPDVIARPTEPWSYEPRLKQDDVEATWRLEDAPQGMTIDADSGSLAWTPTKKQMGRHIARLSAKSKNPRDPRITQPVVVYVVE